MRLISVPRSYRPAMSEDSRRESERTAHLRRLDSESKNHSSVVLRNGLDVVLSIESLARSPDVVGRAVDVNRKNIEILSEKTSEC